MTEDQTGSPKWTGRGAAVFSVVVVMALGALIYANSRSTEQVVAEAAALQAATTTIGANDLALKSLAQAVLLAEDQALGVADDTAVEAGTVEATRSLETLVAEVATLAGYRDEASEVLAPMVAGADRVIEAIDSGDSAAASRILVGEVAPASEALAVVALDIRADKAAALLATGTTSGRLARLAGFLTAFLVPLAAMLAYRRSVRRQLRLAEVQLDARVGAEREVVKAKDQFIADISHELRTPLTSIYGFSEVLLDQGALDPDAANDLVGLINQESGELARMVEDLLVAAREPGKEVPIDVSPVDVRRELGNVIEPFGRLGAQIDVNIEPRWLETDRLRIRHIVRNLVSNAHHHGGNDIVVVGRAVGDDYEIRVTDDGDGVPHAMVPRLFTRFVHEGGEALTTGSVGLGLAVARTLAIALGGELSHRRLEDRTEFTLVLRDVVDHDRVVEATGPAPLRAVASRA
jgi:signal transduction histidine kinase